MWYEVLTVLHGPVFPISKACDSNYDSGTDQPLVSHYSMYSNRRKCQNLSLYHRGWISLLQTSLSQPCTMCSSCPLCPGGDGSPRGTWGLGRRVITCRVPAQSPIPSCSEVEPPEQPGCLPSSILSQAKTLCFSICQNKDLFFMAWLILTFNKPAWEAPPIFPKWHSSSQAVSKKLFAV